MVIKCTVPMRSARRWERPEFYRVECWYEVGEETTDPYLVVTVSPRGLEDPSCDILVLFGDLVSVWWEGWWCPEAGNSYDADGTVDVRLSRWWPRRNRHRLSSVKLSGIPARV